MNKTEYVIERRYITKRSNTRPGTRLTTGTPVFFVAHDTGNPGADADNHYRYFNGLKDRSASAQVFIDDKKILEIIPTGTGTDPAEKAWHVLYNVKTDNERFGDDANDAALGVELCYGGGINFEEAYKRFVWYLAYCCNKFERDPRIHIPSHKQLDPSRKIDCENALKSGGKTFKDLITDVYTVFADKPSAPLPVQDFRQLPVTVMTELLDRYIRPQWAKSRAADQQLEADHFSHLAENVRAAAGIDPKGDPLAAAVRLHKANAQEIIYRWLSPDYEKAKRAGNTTSMAYLHNRANYLRRASGIPIE